MNGTHSEDHETRRVLACLGDPSRFRLVRLLVAGGRCVGELAREVGLSQSCTTRHLQALQRAGLVERRREGKRVRFSLRAEAPGLGRLLEWALAPQAAGIAAGSRTTAASVTGEPGRGLAPAPPSGRSGPEPARPQTRSRPEPTPAVGAEPASEGSSARTAEGEPEAQRRSHSGDLEDFLL